MSITTNIVLCIAITTTTKTIKAPCPDGWSECIVNHSEIRTETEYKPLKLDSKLIGKPKNWTDNRGFSIGVHQYELEQHLDLCKRVYGPEYHNWPDLIPMSVIDDRGIAKPFNHPVAFIFTSELLKAFDIDRNANNPLQAKYPGCPWKWRRN